MQIPVKRKVFIIKRECPQYDKGDCKEAASFNESFKKNISVRCCDYGACIEKKLRILVKPPIIAAKKISKF